MADIFDMADTWNAGGTTFTAIKMDVTDTASAAASKLIDLLVGGASRFSVSKAGVATFVADGTLTYQPTGYKSAPRFLFNSVGSAFARGYAYGFVTSNDLAGIGDTGWSNSQVSLSNTSQIGWGSSVLSAGTTADLTLARDEAGALAQRNGANAQTSRVYGTYTDVSNYRRVALAMTTAGVATLAPEGAGTGASGNVLHIAGLPTSNPGPGILWNNAGTPAIGT